MKFLLALRREVFALHARLPLNLRPPLAMPPSLVEQRGEETMRRHGQGCGSDCGCVCDVQISVDKEGVVTDARFAAKRLVLGSGGAPLRTRAGRLLMQDCTCDTLRSLGSIATSECKGEKLEALRNRLLFSPAAPPSFVRSLLRKIGAPGAAAACTQVVEEALTTVLTDRPYNPLALYAGVSSVPARRRLEEGEGAAEAADGKVLPYQVFRQHGGSSAERYRSGREEVEAVAEKWRRAREEELPDEETDLAEFDFRQQYDDFA